MKRILTIFLLTSLILFISIPAALTQNDPQTPSGTVSGLVQTITIPASKDNTLYESSDFERSNGSGDYLFSGSTGGGNNGLRRRAVVQFNLPPNVSTVITASLTMTVSRSISSSTDMSLHQLTADWGEGSSDAPGNEGAGVAAESGDASWTFAFFDTEAWATEGGDFVSGASAITAVGGSGAYSWQGTQLLADVQAWATDPSSNYGWIMIGDEDNQGTAKRFNARELGNEGPQLTIQYIPAEQIFLPNIRN